MNTNDLFCNDLQSNDVFRENYAWVDELLEKKYYDYISEDEEDIVQNCETFSSYEDEDKNNDSDFDLLIRDLKIIIAYHEDRRQRRNESTDDVFTLFNMLNPKY
jgi:hypothetical protein